MAGRKDRKDKRLAGADIVMSVKVYANSEYSADDVLWLCDFVDMSGFSCFSFERALYDFLYGFHMRDSRFDFANFYRRIPN